MQHQTDRPPPSECTDFVLDHPISTYSNTLQRRTTLKKCGTLKKRNKTLKKRNKIRNVTNEPLPEEDLFAYKGRTLEEHHNLAIFDFDDVSETRWQFQSIPLVDMSNHTHHK
jgi:hypothetical protein